MTSRLKKKLCALTWWLNQSYKHFLTVRLVRGSPMLSSRRDVTVRGCPRNENLRLSFLFLHALDVLHRGCPQEDINFELYRLISRLTWRLLCKWRNSMAWSGNCINEEDKWKTTLAVCSTGPPKKIQPKSQPLYYRKSLSCVFVITLAQSVSDMEIVLSAFMDLDEDEDNKSQGRVQTWSSPHAFHKCCACVCMYTYALCYTLRIQHEEGWRIRSRRGGTEKKDRRKKKNRRRMR